MFRRSFLAGCLGSVAGLGRSAELIDNGPPRKLLDHGPKLPKVPVALVTVTIRQPRGHTHTCSAGHTWDHAENAGHVCTATIGFDADGRAKLCGRPQTTQDAPPRMVRVESVVRTDMTASGWTVTPEVVPIDGFSLSEKPLTLSGGCANGNCPTGGSRAGPLQRLFGR